jgi:hypothetical protein
VARRGTVGALLGSGLVAITALGGAGGYGVGLLTTAERSDASPGTAAPLGVTQPSTPSPSPSPTTPPREVKPDNSPALEASDLSYKARTFTVRNVYKSRVTVRVPADWRMTQPDPPLTARFSDPTGKRWIRIEAGFTISRPPAASMAARIEQLEHLPPDQMLSIISRTVRDKYATLVYMYVPPASQAPVPTVRYVIVRWVADDSGNCAVEMSSTGLPQDKEALMEVLDEATASVVRRDSPLGPS